MISTVKGDRHFVCCRFETIAVDISAKLEKAAAQPKGWTDIGLEKV